MYIKTKSAPKITKVEEDPSTPVYKSKWLPREEYLERKKEEKEKRIIRKNEIETKTIVKNIVNTIFENVIKKHNEEQMQQIRATKYIRPKMRFKNGIRIR